MKRLFGLLVVIFIANMGQAFATDCTVGAEVKDGTTVIGYAFYCKDNSESQKLLAKSTFEAYFGTKLVGLMAAPQDQGKMKWSDAYSVTGVTATHVGGGISNTIALRKEGFPAANLCYDKGQGDASIWQTQWFLPSKDELNLMHKELFSDGNNKGKFSDDWYWSSSEVDVFYAWIQVFTSGTQRHDFKDDHDVRVRCARAF